MIKTIIFLILLGFSFFPALLTPDRIIDELYLVMAVGYDYVDEQLFTGTVVAPNYKVDNTIENITFSDTSSLIYQNREKLEAKSPRPLVSGKLEVALFNRELAEKTGIIEQIDNLQRDPNVGSRVLLAIFEGSTEKLLQKKFTDESTGIYLSNLIDQNVSFDNLSMTNLHTFEFSYFVNGMDPILPLLVEENEKVKVKGVALFKKGKMVADLNKEELLYFKSMHENFRNGTMYIKLENEEEAFLTNIESSRNFEVQQKDGRLNVTITLKMEGIIREYSGKSVDSKTLKNIEQQINEDIQSKSDEMIKQFQDMNIDPIGIGHQVSHRLRNVDDINWREVFPTINVNVKADFTILEHGVIK